MSYVKGSTILAADLNTFLTSVRAVYGVGSGNSGYGQTAITQANVTAGSTISSSHWTNLRSMIATCASHQGTAVSTLPIAGVLAAGQTVTAHETTAPSSNAYDVDSHITSITSNRLTAAAGSMTLTSSAHTVSRATNWSSTITATVDVVFSSEDDARYFFNSGGQVRMKLNHPNGTSAQDVSWRTIADTTVGTLTLSASGVSISGNGAGVAASLGFYNLTTTNQTIYNGANIGSGAYSANDFTIQARVLNRVGTNGGNGNTIRFTVTCSDDYAGVADTVSSGTNLVFAHYRATAHLSGILAPTYSTVSGF